MDPEDKKEEVIQDETTDTTTDASNEIEDSREKVITYESFDDMGLQEHVLKGIYAYGFEKPLLYKKEQLFH